MVVDIADAENGFTLLFSAHPFPGFQLQLDWQRADMSGNWYRSATLDMEGGLCPALLKYFDAPPAQLYAQFRARAK
ncbi:hypothetical protein N4264_05935 [Tahibacter amnicola]|uniref:Activator of Hsp90 ATPase-like protein n=2 Tax=Tahibacter amnicola TaxID=2976241 RepID=A0ABY6BI47_9GAMM|nr:DUF6717 family protein [Tahibacter amnicola]UXI69187.1 hypothetical protein N4264_05935 [Tahibacter amnicola]